VSGSRPGLRPFGPLAVLLAALVLLPRVWTLQDEVRAVRPFRRALALDHARSRNAHKLLVDRWERMGREDLAREEALSWSAAYPERQAVLAAREAEAAGDYARAARLNERAIEINPQYMDAYNNLGSVLILVGMDAEALEALEIAHALSPDEPGVLANLGAVLFRTGDTDRAEEIFLRLHELQPEGFGPKRNLARIAQARGDTAAYRRWIAASAAETDATPAVLIEQGDLLLREGRRTEAIPFLRRAIEGGADPETVRALREALPELAAPPGGG
jgi:tetratricopeptide (TPR) repeat protein